MDIAREREVLDFLNRLNGLVAKNENAFRAALENFRREFSAIHKIDDSRSNDPAHLHKLLDERDRFIVSMGLWSDFVQSLRDGDT